MEFEIRFNDITLNEACGNYSEVKRIMDKEPVYVKDWVIRSDVMIIMPFGICKIVCNFYHDGKIYIVDYSPSSKEIFNEDVRCLKFWASESGWHSPEPTPALTRTWSEYWKHLWDTYVIDSEFFDKKYGKRPEVDFADNQNNESGDDSEE